MNESYGKKWAVGDTVGVFLDTNDRTIGKFNNTQNNEYKTILPDEFSNLFFNYKYFSIKLGEIIFVPEYRGNNKIFPFLVFSLNGELQVDPSAGDAAFSDVYGETFVPACTLGKLYNTS